MNILKFDNSYQTTAVGSGVVADVTALKGIYATSSESVPTFMQFFDSATAPSTGATPVLCFEIPASNGTSSGQIILDELFFYGGFDFTNGLAWGISSTKATFTAVTTPSDHIVIGIVR